MYSKIRGRIVERYSTCKAFAEALGCSTNLVSYKLTGKRPFTARDYKKWSEMLGISTSQIGEYFMEG